MTVGVDGDGHPEPARPGVSGPVVHALLARVRAQYQMTILMVTNDDEVSRTADRVVSMRDGCLVPSTPAGAPR